MFLKRTLLFSLFFTLTHSLAAIADSNMNGTIRIDGSSTVFPITEAVAEEFNKAYPNVRVTVGVSGTGGGFKKFSVNEIDINNASRSIKDSEAELAKKNGISYMQIPVAYDGISVIINSKNTWANQLTVSQLKQIWQPGSKVKTWKDINPTWPDRKIKLYGPGPDSGTFDYFTEEIIGKSGACRSDFTKSEDDNVLVQGVQGDLDALGFFGYAYYNENRTKIKAVAIDGGKGAILPTEKTINDGTYAPLSRPLFIYVSKKSLQKKETKSFVNFYIKNAGNLAKEVGYVPLPVKMYADDEKKFEQFASNKD